MGGKIEPTLFKYIKQCYVTLHLFLFLPSSFLFLPSLLSFKMSYRRSDYADIAMEYATAAATRTRTSLHIGFIYARGGILIGMATNRVGSRSSGAGFSGYTIHAERAVLKAVGDNNLLRGATMVVVRVSKGGIILPSEPCHECKCHLGKAMRVYGLRKVYYS